jgi:Ca2+-binding RTX toxin-like protein
MTTQILDLTTLATGDGFMIQGDNPSDRAGQSVSNAGDVNGDGIDDFLVSASYHDGGGTDAGRTYIIFGRASATRANIDLTSFSASDGFYVDGDADGNATGYAVSAVGDINGDGIDDFAVASQSASAGSGVNSGAVYVIFGKTGATRTNIDLSALSASDGFVIIGDAATDFFGRSVSGAGDVNNDRIDDLIIGAPGGDDGGPSAGEAYVIYGRTGATRANIDVTSLTATDGFIVIGNLDDERAGTSVSGAGDINGDGIEDFIVGAPYSDDGGNIVGKAYVLFGKAGATRPNLDMSTLSASDGFFIRGIIPGNIAGDRVSNAGDVNGDGIDDLIIGGYRAGGGGSGAAYVIFGRTGATRSNIDLATLSPNDGFTISGDALGDQFGRSVSNAGDVNGDGIDDLIIGADRGDDGGTDAGEAYVILGRAGTTRSDIDVTSLAASDGFIIRGDSTGDRAGRSVSAAGDVNNDGIDDLVVGAFFEDTGGFRAGASYIIYGNRNFGAINGTASGETLTGTAGADRLNGFAGNDVLDGGAGADTLAGGADSDIYVVDNAGDVVTEAANEGNDRVETDLASYTLPDNVEDLEYTGAGAFTGNGNGLGNIIVGGGLGDAINGNDGDDTLGGEAGNDTLNGGNGSDRLIGGTGADTMNGGAGNDRLIVDNAGDVANGGDGVDTVDFSTAGLTYAIAGDVEIVRNVSGGDLTITLNGLHNSYAGSETGVDTVFGGDGQDTLYGRGGNDQLNGEGSNDYLFGGAGADTLAGGDGVDLLNGGTENDNLAGGAGNDEIYGEAGDDVLFGSSGADLLHGGAGADLFYFAALTDSGTTRATSDFIRDFNQAQGDRIDLSAIDAMAGGTDEAFSFIGTAAFTGVAGQLRAELIAGETVVSGDINGDGVADFMIRIDGGFTLTAADFVL